MAAEATTADERHTSLQPSGEAGQARGWPALQYQHQRSLLSSRAGGPAAIVAPNLAGRPKVWFVIGRGRGGKTTLVRYVMERLSINSGAALAAALDPVNRSLAGFFDGVVQPPTSHAITVARWLESLLLTVLENGTSALLDLGTGDTSLGRFLSDVPDLVTIMEDAGVAPVAVHLLGPRVDDLVPLEMLEAQGFQPRATALVLNEGLVDRAIPRDDVFIHVMQHPTFKAAVARGAVVLWMPRLEQRLALEIEAKRLSFADVRDGVPLKSSRSVPFNVFDRSRVRTWMVSMDAMIAPITTWLP